MNMPPMIERCKQALAKMALEPEWEAKFEPNSYGFRPGCSCHDAREAIFIVIRSKPKYVFDADIKGAFDNIDQEALGVNPFYRTRGKVNFRSLGSKLPQTQQEVDILNSNVISWY